MTDFQFQLFVLKCLLTLQSLQQINQESTQSILMGQFTQLMPVFQCFIKSQPHPAVGGGAQELLSLVLLQEKVECKRKVTSQVTSESLGQPPSVAIFGFLQERIQERTTVKGEKVYSGKKHTPQTECGPSQKAKEAPGYRVFSFYRGGKLHNLMNGRSIQQFGGRSEDFQKLGHHPLFDLFWSSWNHDGTEVCYSEHMLRLKVKQKMNLPSRTQYVLISLYHILRLYNSFKICALSSVSVFSDNRHHKLQLELLSLCQERTVWLLLNHLDIIYLAQKRKPVILSSPL